MVNLNIIHVLCSEIVGSFFKVIFPVAEISNTVMISAQMKPCVPENYI